VKVFLEATSVWCRDAATVILFGSGAWYANLTKGKGGFPPPPSFMAAFAVGMLPVLILWPVTIPVILLLFGLSWLAKNLAGMVREQQKIL